MGSSLYPALANIYMDWLERSLFEKNIDKPKLWIRYVDDTFIIWQHGKEKLKNFFEYLNSIAPTIKFTGLELEINDSLPFLDGLVNHGHGTLSYTANQLIQGNILINSLIIQTTQKRGGMHIRTLQSRAKAICSNEGYLKNEIDNIVRDFLKNGYRQIYVNKTLTIRKVTHKDNNKEVRCRLVIPYIRGTSKKIRRIATKYGLRTAFHSRNTIGKQLCNTMTRVSKLE